MLPKLKLPVFSEDFHSIVHCFSLQMTIAVLEAMGGAPTHSGIPTTVIQGYELKENPLTDSMPDDILEVKLSGCLFPNEPFESRCRLRIHKHSEGFGPIAVSVLILRGLIMHGGPCQIVQDRGAKKMLVTLDPELRSWPGLSSYR